jgi:hypothetical protein
MKILTGLGPVKYKKMIADLNLNFQMEEETKKALDNDKWLHTVSLLPLILTVDVDLRFTSIKHLL